MQQGAVQVAAPESRVCWRFVHAPAGGHFSLRQGGGREVWSLHTSDRQRSV